MASASLNLLFFLGGQLVEELVNKDVKYFKVGADSKRKKKIKLFRSSKVDLFEIIIIRNFQY